MRTSLEAAWIAIAALGACDWAVACGDSSGGSGAASDRDAGDAQHDGAQTHDGSGDGRMSSSGAADTGPDTTGSCTDGMRDGQETDVDCGGPMCPPCANTKACTQGSDCQSGFCSGAACAPWAAQVSAGDAATCALTTTGEVLCWGDNRNYQLGDADGGVASSATPVPVAQLAGAKSVSTGMQHACAVTSAGGVVCWGDNSDGELGDGSNADSDVPVPVTGLSSGVVAVSAGAGGEFTCALTQAGQVMCWGDNEYGQLGSGTSASSSNVPVAVPSLSGVTAISAGDFFVCAVLASAGAACWGSNTDGQLGDGTMNDSTTPVTVSGLMGVAALSARYGHACAVMLDGHVACWGEDGFGQLGDGMSADRETPFEVAGVAGASGVGSGDYNSCALLSSGGAMCWGDNTLGQLGNGGGSSHGVAVAVELTGSSALSTGDFHSCAITSAGGVACWGVNDSGQLGDGSHVMSPVPARVIR